jgi:peptide/nickel transport system substrate-binding protein
MDEVKSQVMIGDYALHLISVISNAGLTQMDEKGEKIGALTESYEASSDSKVWTFILKDNLFWSDGKPVTAEDVVFSLQMLGETPNNAWIKKIMTDMKADGNKVTLTLNEPYPNLAHEFCFLNTVPKHIWESVEKPMEHTGGAGGSYVGWGPFVIDSVDLSAGKVILKKNPFWKGKAPYYDSIEISWFKNTDTASKALEAGAMDTYWRYADSYPFANIESLKATGKFDILEKPSSGIVYLGFNLKKDPTSDLKFRKAVSEAINYQELVDICIIGHGKVPNAGLVPPVMIGYIDTDQLQYNPSEAKKILEEAGFKDSDGNGMREGKDGSDITLNFLVRKEYNREGELIKEYLKNVGIGAEIRSVDRETWIDVRGKSDYDIGVTWTTPSGMYQKGNWGTVYFDGRSGRNTSVGMANIDDPAFTDLIDNVKQTGDKTKLAEYGKEIQQYYAENLPAIALYWKNEITPYNKAITGCYSNPLYGIFNLFTFTGAKPVAA